MTSRCPTCKALIFFGKHTCPPLWLVATEADPSEISSVYARDCEEAAEKWAEEDDSNGEYYLARGNEIVVLVGAPGGDLVRVVVQGETVPSYSARELGPAPAPEAPALTDAARQGVTATGPSCVPGGNNDL